MSIAGVLKNNADGLGYRILVLFDCEDPRPQLYCGEFTPTNQQGKSK